MSEKKEIKVLYSFVVDETIETEQTDTIKNEDGSETTTKKKVKTTIPRNLCIRKPNRSLRDEADFYYNQVLSQNTKAGIVSIANLAKLIENDGGILSDAEKKQKTELLADLLRAQTELQFLSTQPEKDLEKIKQQEVICSETIQKIQVIDQKESSLFSNTAEMRAQTKTLFWWMLFLSYFESNGTYLPFFGEGNLADRLKKYDELEESESEFNAKAINEFSKYVSIIFLTSSFTADKIHATEKLISGT